MRRPDKESRESRTDELNLWEPVDDGDDGAHGRFGDRAKGRSYQIWASTHRDTLLGVILLALVGAAILRWRTIAGVIDTEEESDGETPDAGFDLIEGYQ